jgi:hypothetical protein
VTLLALLACALGLRVWGIWFGLPHVFHNDEGFEIVRALQLGTGEYNFTRITKGGYFYLLFVEYGFLFIGLLAFGIIGSPAEFGEYYVKDPSAFYLIGRATTAVIGTLTVYMVYRLGRIAYSTSVALFAAALLAFNILHSYLSHLTTVDIPLALLTTVSLYFAVKMALDGNHKNYWWAALFAALATTTKIPAVLLLVPMVIAHCYFVSNRGGTPGQYFFSKHLWQAAAIYLVCYAILTPGIVIYFEQVLSMGLTKFAGGTEVAADLGEDGLDPASPRANLNLFVYYYQAIVDSMTWPIFAVSAAGIAYAIWKHRPVDVILVSFAIVVYVVMSSATHEHHFFPRYMAPALPIFAVLGGRLLGDLAGLFPERRQKVLVPAVIVLLAAWPAAEIAAYNNAMLKPDTRAIAREWFDANIPPGSKVFIEGSRTAVSNATIPLQNSAENLKDSIEFYRDSEPGRAKYFRMALKTLSGSSYDLVGVQGDDLRELQYYKDAGVQYFVLRPDKYGGSALRYHWPEIVEDIRSDPDIELVKRFEPSEATSGRSPLLEIYRVNSNVDLRTRAE